MAILQKYLLIFLFRTKTMPAALIFGCRIYVWWVMN